MARIFEYACKWELWGLRAESVGGKPMNVCGGEIFFFTQVGVIGPKWEKKKLGGHDDCVQKLPPY